MGLDTDFGTAPQPAPVETEKSQSVTDLVISDLRARREGGKKKYGTELKTHNGRDPLLDLYQELHDALVYCRQALAERDERVQIVLTKKAAAKLVQDLNDLVLGNGGAPNSIDDLIDALKA